VYTATGDKVMDNFNPTIKCPHCGQVNRPSISGWGREGLNNRQHTCKHCNKDYTVVVYVETSTDYKISDMHIRGLKSRIEARKEQIREMESGLVSEATGLAREYIRVEASTGGSQN